MNNETSFKPIKTLDVESTLELIGKHEDVLSKEFNREKDYFSHINCIKCGSKNVRCIPLIIDGKPAFGEYLPKNIFKCECGCEFEPYTKVIVKSR